MHYLIYQRLTLTFLLYSFISGMLLEFCYVSMNYNVSYRFQTINLMISWKIALTPKQSSSATSGSAVKVWPLECANFMSLLFNEISFHLLCLLSLHMQSRTLFFSVSNNLGGSMMSPCHSFHYYNVCVWFHDYVTVLSYSVLSFIWRHGGLLIWRCYC